MLSLLQAASQPISSGPFGIPGSSWLLQTAGPVWIFRSIHTPSSRLFLPDISCGLLSRRQDIQHHRSLLAPPHISQSADWSSQFLLNMSPGDSILRISSIRIRIPSTRISINISMNIIRRKQKKRKPTKKSMKSTWTTFESCGN